eukprot:s8226_g4.t1
MLILDNDGRVPYLQYNRAEQKLEKDLRAIGGIEGFGRPSANHAPLSCGASSSLADTGRDRTDDAGGIAACAVESLLVDLENTGKRVSFMTGANLVVFVVAALLGLSINAEDVGLSGRD